MDVVSTSSPDEAFVKLAAATQHAALGIYAACHNQTQLQALQRMQLSQDAQLPVQATPLGRPCVVASFPALALQRTSSTRRGMHTSVVGKVKRVLGQLHVGFVPLLLVACQPPNTALPLACTLDNTCCTSPGARPGCVPVMHPMSVQLVDQQAAGARPHLQLRQLLVRQWMNREAAEHQPPQRLELAKCANTRCKAPRQQRRPVAAPHCIERMRGPAHCASSRREAAAPCKRALTAYGVCGRHRAEVGLCERTVLVSVCGSGWCGRRCVTAGGVDADVREWTYPATEKNAGACNASLASHPQAKGD
eukprot:363437-Chlamydomonas_euryale.AAC.2